MDYFNNNVQPQKKPLDIMFGILIITSVLIVSILIYGTVKYFDYQKLNGKTFIKPNIINFPLLKILSYKINNTYFEIILVSLNDELVRRYLNNKIPYISIHKIMLELLKKRYFSKYYTKSPRNIYEIKLMVKKVNQYLDNYI